MSPTTTPLGIPGFTFADLHQPARLRELYERFVDEVEGDRARAVGAVGAVSRRRRTRSAPVARGNLIVAMAPHVSRFVARLFGVGAEAEALVAATRAYDVLFRFKIDFVRRRALPLLKGGAHVTATAEDHALVEEPCRRPDFDRPGARAARSRGRLLRCSIAKRRLRAGGTDADKAARRRRDRVAEALVRRAPPRPALSRLGRVPLSRERSTTTTWCRSSGRDPALPEAMVGPDEKLRRRDGFALTDARYTRARGAERDPLLRALPRARQGLLLEGHSRQGRRGRRPTRSASRWPAARSTRRSPRCTLLRKRGDAHRRAGDRHRRQPDVPGHRPPHLQRLHEGLHLPEAGAGQHPADRDRRPDRRAEAAVGRRDLRPADALEPAERRSGPYALPYNGKNVLVVGLGPAGYTLSHYLLNEGFGVVGDRRPEDRAAARRLDRRATAAPPRPIRDWAEIYRPLDERVLEGFGGVSEYGITVRWDKNFLTLIHLTLARRDKLADLRRRALRRHAAARRGVGARASTTSRSPPAPAGRRSSTSRTT